MAESSGLKVPWYYGLLRWGVEEILAPDKQRKKSGMHKDTSAYRVVVVVVVVVVFEVWSLFL